MNLSRRDLLKTLPVAAGAVLASAKADKPDVVFPTSARDRLSVSTYPFRSVIGTGKMTLEQFAATIPEKLNVPGIEPWSPHFTSLQDDYVHGLHDAFSKAGLHVVNIPVDIRVKLCGTDEDRKAALSAYFKWVDAAIILKSPSIRVHLPHGESGENISCPVSAMKELAAYGAEKNIVVNIENDDPHGEQPERVARVIEAVNSPYLHALPDFCNSMLVQNDEAFNNQALATLFALAYNISHVKDSEEGDGKVYRVSVDQIFAVAKKAGYRGYFSMEFEGSGDPYAGTADLISASMRNLS